MKIELYYTMTDKCLIYGSYKKDFKEATSIDYLLNKITDKNLPVTIYANKEDILKHQISSKSNPFLYTYIEAEDLPVFDEHILEQDLSSIKLKKYKPKLEWQLQFGKEIYITNDNNLRQQFIDKDVFCFAPEDLLEFKKNNWNIDDNYMIRVFFNGKKIGG